MGVKPSHIVYKGLANDRQGVVVATKKRVARSRAKKQDINKDSGPREHLTMHRLAWIAVSIFFIGGCGGSVSSGPGAIDFAPDVPPPESSLTWDQGNWDEVQWR